MSLCELSYRNLEIIVVDNGSDEDATQIMVSELQRTRPHIRYVREDRLGLSCARNRGVTEAKGEILAFTDDDVRVDPLWIDGLLRGFARSEDVACVTGLVASSSLQHPAEQYFDGRVWWSSSCCHELHQPPRAGDGGLYPYASGKFGTGANFAFRTAQLRDLGRFDECLGAGSPSSGGEDLDIFVRVLRGGHSLSYEPCALVWHDHRVDERSLKRQMYAYGKGLGAYLTKYLLSPTTGPDVARRLARGLMHGAALANRSTETKRSAGVGPGVLRTEMRGLLAGPPAYLGARLRQGSRRAGPR